MPAGTSDVNRGQNICKNCGVQGGEYLREFTQFTTLHGVSYVGEQKTHYLEKLFWVITIIISSIFCGIEVTKLWTRWTSFPVIISFSARPTNVASIPLPALTICPENKVRRSVLDVEKNLDIITRQLDGKLRFDSPDKKLEAEAISMICAAKVKQYVPLLPSKSQPTSKHKELIEKVISPRFDDTFVKCFFEDEVDCRKLFRPIMTNFGMCFSFNILHDIELFSKWQNTTSLDPTSANYSRKSRWDPEEGYEFPRSEDDFPRRGGIYVGPMLGLQVVLKSLSEDTQETCSRGSPDSFRVALHPPIDFPDVIYGNYFTVTSGGDFSVSLRPSTVVTSPELRRYSPLVRGCNFPEDRRLRLFRTYTENNCILDCEAALYRRHRNCQFMHFPLEKNDNLTYCSIDSIQYNSWGDNFTAIHTKTFYNDVEEQLDKEGVAAVCGCLPSCTEYRYDYYVTNTKLDIGPRRNLTNRESYSLIKLFYEEPTFFGKRRSELYGVTDFIASSGGLLGLYTGFSLMSLVEICYFASLRLACRVRRNRGATVDHLAN